MSHAYIPYYTNCILMIPACVCSIITERVRLVEWLNRHKKDVEDQHLELSEMVDEVQGGKWDLDIAMNNDFSLDDEKTKSGDHLTKIINKRTQANITDYRIVMKAQGIAPEIEIGGGPTPETQPDDGTLLNKFLHADSTQADTWSDGGVVGSYLSQQFNGRKIDIFVTSPPWGVKPSFKYDVEIPTMSLQTAFHELRNQVNNIHARYGILDTYNNTMTI